MFTDILDDKKGHTFFIKSLVAVFLIRLIISIFLPITGDEAYFVVWGNNLDYGYYDHTPFVGWLLAAFLFVSDALWWLRLPSTLLPVFISYGVYHILKQQQPKVAVIVALTFLVAPVNIINVLITTDTPLIFFSFVSAWFFYLAIFSSTDEIKSYKLFLLVGLFLGLAFFSKYFAVFLGFTYGLYIVFFQRNKRCFIGLALILLMVLPFVFINILWNYNNCWSNILFNLYNRAASVGMSFTGLYKYLIVLVYLYSPVLIFFLLKNRKKYFSENNSYQIYLWLSIIPLVLFLALSLKKTIGLHWLFSFYPFVFIALSSFLDKNQWRITFYFMAVFCSLHLVFLAAILVLPITTFTSDKNISQNYAFGMQPSKFLDQLKPYEKDYTFSMLSYGLGSVASYYANKHFVVFSEGSVHGRVDDKLTSFKELDGENILLIIKSKDNLKMYEQFFEESERKVLEVDSVRFELILGQRFIYELYREKILSKINERYYKIPDWLPKGSCHLKEKYNLN